MRFLRANNLFQSLIHCRYPFKGRIEREGKRKREDKGRIKMFLSSCNTAMKRASQAVLPLLSVSLHARGPRLRFLALSVIFFLVSHPTLWLIASHVYLHPRFLIFIYLFNFFFKVKFFSLCIWTKCVSLSRNALSTLYGDWKAI